jgi:hypothetical protein
VSLGLLAPFFWFALPRECRHYCEERYDNKGFFVNRTLGNNGYIIRSNELSILMYACIKKCSLWASSSILRDVLRTVSNAPECRIMCESGRQMRVISHDVLTANNPLHLEKWVFTCILPTVFACHCESPARRKIYIS